MGTIRTTFFALCIAGVTTFAQDAAQLQPPVSAPVTVAPVIEPPVTQPVPETIVTPAPEAVVTQTPGASHTNAPAKPKKPAAPKMPTARGSVAKLDNVAMTITVNAKGKDETFKVTSKTRVFADGAPAIFADGKVGENAIVEFQNSKDKASKEALTIRFGGSAPHSDKTGAKATDAPKPDAKKGAAHKPKHKAKPAVVPANPAPDAPAAPAVTTPVTPQ